MPIIKGVKMACEPCIRGHRSTKCNHANERMMIQVRKPGRPLSVCPHPTSNGCSCSTVTAALPRTKKCGCGSKSASHSTTKQQKAQLRRSAFSPSVTSPLFTAPPHSHFDAAGVPSVVTSPSDSPTKHSWPAPSAADDARISGNQNGGQYSLDTQGFPLNYAVQESQPFPLKDPSFPYGYAIQPPLKNTDLYLAGNNIGLGPYFPSAIESPAHPGPKSEFDNIAFDMKSIDMAATQFHHLQMLGPQGPAVMGVQPQNMHAAAAASMPVPAQRAMPHAAETATAAPKKSCCGHGPPAVANTPPGHTPTSSTNSLVSTGTGGASLVSNSAASSASSLAGPVLFADYLPQQQNNGAQAWANYSAGLDTVTAPLEQSQWPMQLTASAAGPHIMPAMDLTVFAASMPMNGAPAMPSRDMGVMATAPVPDADVQAHLCECGDGCECEGCVVHPYNEATRNTIHAALSSMMFPPSLSINAGAVGITVPPMAPAAKAATATAAQAAPPAAHQPSANGSPAKAVARTPSDASGASDEQTDLPPDDFLFVSYSFTDCKGETNTCPCGDDCQCFGCAVHNNPAV